MNKLIAKKTCHDKRGFTLVELMITLVISSFVIIAVSSAYIAQQKSYTAQDQVTEMQQNIRAAIDFMAREIRMAGYDPLGTAGSAIISATGNRFNFTQDITNNTGTALDGDGSLGDPNEDINFGFSNANDGNNDGQADAGAAPLGRDTGGGFQPIAENMAAVEFNYTLDDGSQTLTPGAGSEDKVRFVTVSLLARAGRPDPQFNNTMTYTTDSGAVWGPFNDNFRRRLLIATVQCRNMGL